MPATAENPSRPLRSTRTRPCVPGNDVRLTRKQLLLVLSVAGVLVMALIYARRPPQLDQNAQPASVARHRPLLPLTPIPPSALRATEQIARTYSLTGMARSFSRVSGSEFQTLNRLYHKASDRHYAIVERDGRLYQRRHQMGFDGREVNVLELEAHYVVGSGNHARTFVHRKR